MASYPPFASNTIGGEYRLVGQSGFTLLEMLIVILLIGLMVAFVPRLSTSAPQLRVHSAAMAISADVRALRLTALSRHIRTTLVPESESAYTIQPDGIHRALPDKITLSISVRAGLVSGDNVRLSCFPDGSCTEATLSIRGAGLTTELHVHWLDGGLVITGA